MSCLQRHDELLFTLSNVNDVLRGIKLRAPKSQKATTDKYFVHLEIIYAVTVKASMVRLSYKERLRGKISILHLPKNTPRTFYGLVFIALLTIQCKLSVYFHVEALFINF